MLLQVVSILLKAKLLLCDQEVDEEDLTGSLPPETKLSLNTHYKKYTFSILRVFM